MMALSNRTHISVHIDDAAALNITGLLVQHTDGPTDYVTFAAGGANFYFAPDAARGLMEKLGAYFAEREAQAEAA